MMIIATLLLAAFIGNSYACDVETPDCSTCSYNDNIGFIRHASYCGVYFECTRNPHKLDEYKHRIRCCPEGLSFNEESQGCDWDNNYVPGCLEGHGCCPVLPVLNPDDFVCHYHAYDGEDSKYVAKLSGEVFNCAAGTVWDQGDCVCVWGGFHLPPPCAQIMSFQFEGSFDSYSCNNWVDGTPIGNPDLDYAVLNLDGDDYLLISYFNTFFAGNPTAFTVCLWINPSEQSSYGIFSTNCRNGGDSLLDLYVDEGTLQGVLGSDQAVSLGPITAGIETKICVTFNNGFYEVYVNAVSVYAEPSSFVIPVNSHVPATLGLVDGFNLFQGYVDDFSFWTRVLSQEDIDQCFTDRVNPHGSGAA